MAAVANRQWYASTASPTGGQCFSGRQVCTRRKAEPAYHGIPFAAAGRGRARLRPSPVRGQEGLRYGLSFVSLVVLLMVSATPFAAAASGDGRSSTVWEVNELEYLEAPGLSAMVFHDIYPDGRQSGIVLTQHGERVATRGDLRLDPGWSRLQSRESLPQECIVKANLSHSGRDLRYTVAVQGEGRALRVRVDLDQALPEDLVGLARFQLEFFPPAYFGKTYHLGDSYGVIRRQGDGPLADRGPIPLATGPKLVLAPEDPQHMVTIEAVRGGLELVDERDANQEAWLVVRSFVPSGATRAAIEWVITPNSVPGWRRDPVIGISQVGYHPDQEKRAIIELDPRTEVLEAGSVLRMGPDGKLHEVMSAPPHKWGKFLRYEYAVLDFTNVREPGLYVLRYGDCTSHPFRISRDLFQSGVWQPTLETYLPVQMCHVEVRDRVRLWHGVCHLDDALQAPTSHQHFDGYRQGPDTDTSYSVGQHIPHLDRGGWHDAGDDDLAAGSQAHTTLMLALAGETFRVDSDQTTVDKERRLVRLHTPDGVPDIVQQVAHGAENLLSGYRAAGHSFAGIIPGNADQYFQWADWGLHTDNLVCDPSLAPDEVADGRSGKGDDRWAFTSRDTSLEYQVAAALAAASRVLRGHEEDLATECLRTAVKTWEYEQNHQPVEFRGAYVPRNSSVQEVLATAELLITTGEDRYRRRLLALLPVIESNIRRVGWVVARALPSVGDADFASAVRKSVAEYQEKLRADLAASPYRVPFRPAIWGIGWEIQSHAVGLYYLIKTYPELFDREDVLAVVNFVLGCHPGSNVSFVSGVGARSLTMAYGINRDDWSYIPGAVASGTALIRPDFPELKEDFPFLWQQAENVIGGAATYVFCVLAADELLNGPRREGLL